MKGAPAAPRAGKVGRVEPARRRRRDEPPPKEAKPPRGPLVASLGHLGSRIADAYLAAGLFLAGELVIVAAVRHAELLAIGEAFVAARLVPLALVALAPLAIVAGGLYEAIAASDKAWPRRIASAIVAAAGGAVAYGVGTGRHLAGARRPAFAVAVAFAAGAIVYAIAPAVARWLAVADSRKRLFVIAPAALGIASFAEVANALVLPRLYPAFHVGLAAVALVAIGGLALAAPPRARSPFFRPILALALFAASAAIAPTAARQLATSDNVRFIYAEHAPILGRAVELGARIAPPPSLDVAEVPEGPGEVAKTIDLNGVDVVLISIDALRADHLGVYGYDRPTSPNIDRLAKEGVVFEAAYTTTPHTSYAITSLMTGKYMRPLLLQGLGADSETWAEHLRRYGYRTAAFYPPAVFFIDGERFQHFHETAYGFEYKKEEFADPALREKQVTDYLATATADQRLFLWVHLFEPHEPYEAHADHPFGDRDVDRYDSEIAEADDGVGKIVDAIRKSRPNALVIITADHGEEFGDHGGRYHGTSVYEEQVRVPLVVLGKGIVKPGRVKAAVQLIDLLPTVLRGLDIPRPARIRGRDIGAALAGTMADDDPGQAFAETDTMTMFAEDAFRLVCMRRAGACTLYNVRRDPSETRDVTGNHPDVVARLRASLTSLEASHGKYEARGEGTDEKAWPEALRRGIAGDGDAVNDIAPLLDDADADIRRKTAEVLFDLGRPEAIAALKLALARDEDDGVKDFASLALTRLGEGSPRTIELLAAKDRGMRRLAALALAESGDDRGADELVAWWRSAFPTDAGDKPEPLEYERAKEILGAFSKTKPRTAIMPLIGSLGDVRLRPLVASTLADIGDDAARVPLADQLLVERYQTARVAIVEALLRLHAGAEIVAPLVALLGMPDPLPRGLEAAIKTKMLQHVGGPGADSDLTRLKRFATSGVSIDFFVPKVEVDKGVRAICLAKSDGDGEIRIGRRLGLPTSVEKKSPIPTESPPLDPARSVTLTVGASPQAIEVYATLPSSLEVHPGKPVSLVIYATQKVSVEACALVPLRDELPPPRHSRE